MAIRLQQEGITDFVVLERGDSVGGTWRDNSYPGCQCDVPSTLYSLSFAPNPDWTRTYSPQREIHSYLQRVSVEHGVEPFIRYGTTVTDAAWDDDAQRWTVETDRGSLTCDILIAGMGPLSEPSIPAIPGVESFEGTMFHSATWDHDHELEGKRVAVVGTGASAIQFVPRIQRKVDHMVLFQRTPPWVLPHPNRKISDRERAVYRRFPLVHKLNRLLTYGIFESRAPGFTRIPFAMRLGELVGRMHLRKQVADRALRKQLTPQYRLGCKRILMANDWYPAITAENVDLRMSGLQEIRPNSVVGLDGTEHEVDTIIFGTGFHVTDPPAGDHVRGRDGLLLSDHWREHGMSSYLGSTFAGFPNLFMLVGPNTGLGHNSMVYMIESHINYVLDAIKQIDRQGLTSVEVRQDVQDAYNAELQAKMPPTVWSSGGCVSWYLDDHGRNPTIWPDFTFRFRQRTRRFVPGEYVVRTREREPVAAA
jgi:cation diffusion facilitator CzcD-associated flavoprotein CzcO